MFFLVGRYVHAKLFSIDYRQYCQLLATARLPLAKEQWGLRKPNKWRADRGWIPFHQLTLKCTDPCRKTTFLLEGAFLHFHVGWWEGKYLSLFTFACGLFLRISSQPTKVLSFFRVQVWPGLNRACRSLSFCFLFRQCIRDLYKENRHHCSPAPRKSVQEFQPWRMRFRVESPALLSPELLAEVVGAFRVEILFQDGSQ